MRTVYQPPPGPFQPKPRMPGYWALMRRPVGSIVLHKGYYWTVALERYGSNGGLVKSWRLSIPSELRAAGIHVA